MDYVVPLPFHPTSGVFVPQIIDVSQSCCKSEQTGFQIGFTAPRHDKESDSLFKHAVRPLSISFLFCKVRLKIFHNYIKA